MVTQALLVLEGQGWLEEELEPEYRGRSTGSRGGQSRRKKGMTTGTGLHGLTGGRKQSTSDPNLLDEKTGEVMFQVKLTRKGEPVDTVGCSPSIRLKSKGHSGRKMMLACLGLPVS